MMRLFVNYADQDQPTVTRLGQLLEDLGHQVWIDTPQPGVSRDWQAAVMRDILGKCDGVVNVVSADASRARYWVNVVDWSTVNGLPIVNLVIDASALPAIVQSFPTIPAQDGLTGGVIQALVQAIDEFEDHRPANEQASADAVINNDLPEGEDHLGFKDYAVAFAQMVTNPLVKPPIVVGIYGQWGTGKTFLMHQIEKEVLRIQGEHTEKQRFRGARKPNVPMRVLTVDFDAWAFNASDNLWAGLVEMIFKKIEDQFKGFEKIRFNVSRNLAREWRQLILRLFYLVALIGSFGLALYLIFTQLEFDLLASIVPILGLPVLVRYGRDIITLLATPQSRQLAGVVTASASTYNERRFLKSIVQPQERNVMGRVYDDMSKMLDALPEHSRIAVFIDDLDRCKPDRVIEVLEAITLLLAFREFVVFLAVDTRVVASIVEANYEDTLTRAGISGYDYLDKIVQLPFNMPQARPRDLFKYLNTLIQAPPEETQNRNNNTLARIPVLRRLTQETPTVSTNGESPEDDGIGEEFIGLSAADLEFAKIDADEEDKPSDVQIVNFTYAERNAFRAFSYYMDPTPRRIKRLVNVYRMVRAVAIRQDWDMRQVPAAKLLLWLLLSQQWPYATAMILDARRRIEDEGITLARLYDVVADALDDDKQHRKMDYDNLVLDEIIEHYGQHISGADIDTMQRLTIHFHPELAEEIRSYDDITVTEG